MARRKTPTSRSEWIRHLEQRISDLRGYLSQTPDVVQRIAELEEMLAVIKEDKPAWDAMIPAGT